MTIDFTTIGFNGGLGAVIGAAAAVFGGLFAAYFGVKSAANAAERRLLNLMSVAISLISLAVLFVVLLALDKGLAAWGHWAIDGVYGLALWRMVAYTRREAARAREAVDLSFLQNRVPTAIAEAEAHAPEQKARSAPLSPAAG